MKVLFCTLFMLVIVNTLLAVPPSAFPDPVKVAGGTAYVVHVVEARLHPFDWTVRVLIS